MSDIIHLSTKAINIPKPRVCLTTFRLLMKEEKLSTLKGAKGERIRVQKTKKFPFFGVYLWLRKRFDSTPKRYRAFKWKKDELFHSSTKTTFWNDYEVVGLE